MITIICAVILFVFADNFLNLPSQLNKNIAYAHFFGKQKTIDNYRIVFQPSSSTPSAGENATLNFSILVKDNLNVNNVYAALIIKEKNTGKVVGQIPYKFYEFSDITFPYKFQNNLDYTANLESIFTYDPAYYCHCHCCCYYLNYQLMLKEVVFVSNGTICPIGS
jgi:hypothetical protein